MNKYNSIYKNTMTVLLILFIVVMVFLNIITPSKAFSESENRRLEQLPEFSFNNLFRGKFTSNFEKYIADQFVFRDFWIGIKSDTQRALGENESNGVYLGKDGYLIQNFNKPNTKSFKDKMEAINSFATSIPNFNKYIMLIPNSVEILKDKLPNYAPADSEVVYLNKVKNSLDKSIKFVDIYNELNSRKDEYIYYKTDHHWTTQAAFYAYEKLAKDMGIKPKDENYFNIKKVTDKFYGSLYSKGGFRHINPDSIKLYIPKEKESLKVEYLQENKVSNSIYSMDNLNKKDKYTVFFNGNHSLIKISTNAANGKKILIAKDSYANCFIPLLTAHYSEIYVVDLRYYNEDIRKLVKNNNIKDMLILYNVKTFSEDESINNILE